MVSSFRLLCAVVGSAAVAVPPTWSPLTASAGLARHHSDAQCSLNGKVVGGQCQCDPPWRGASCGVLTTEAAKPGGVYGYSHDNCTFRPVSNPSKDFPCSSWGGNALKGDDGKWHLFVAQFKYGRHMDNESECVHAVSDSLSGPYTKHDVAVPDTCHNPATIRDPQSGKYLMFHIGYGNPIGSCPSPGGCAGHTHSNLNPGAGFLHTSASPAGPWSPLNLSHPNKWAGKKPLFLRHSILEMTILPRQARDKHRES
jgi:hypothetical protein